jgi:hypothetical protein
VCCRHACHTSAAGRANDEEGCGGLTGVTPLLLYRY